MSSINHPLPYYWPRFTQARVEKMTGNSARVYAMVVSPLSVVVSIATSGYRSLRAVALAPTCPTPRVCF